MRLSSSMLLAAVAPLLGSSVRGASLTGRESRECCCDIRGPHLPGGGLSEGLLKLWMNTSGMRRAGAGPAAKAWLTVDKVASNQPRYPRPGRLSALPNGQFVASTQGRGSVGCNGTSYRQGLGMPLPAVSDKGINPQRCSQRPKETGRVRVCIVQMEAY